MLRKLVGLLVFCFVGIELLSLGGCGGGSSPSPTIQPPAAPTTGAVEGYIYVPEKATATGREESLALSRQEPPPGYIPVANCLITAVVGESEKITHTDQNGYFLISGLPSGQAQITVSPPPATEFLPELGINFKEFTTTLEVRGNTVASLGHNGQVSLISHSADHLDLLIRRLDWSDFPRVKVYCEVEDPEWRAPIIGLGKANFSIQINDLVIAITRLSQVIQSQEKAAVSFVLDISPSMEGEPFDKMLSATEMFVGWKAKRDEYKLVAFDHNIYTTYFTADKDEILDDIATLRRWGVGNGTGFYDAVEYAVLETDRHAFSNKAVIALTDGGDNTSHLSFKELLDLVKMRPVPVYTIGLPGYSFEKSRSHQKAVSKPTILPWEELREELRNRNKTKTLESGVSTRQTRKESELVSLAQASGGKYFYLPPASDLAGIYTSIARIKQQEYILEVSLSSKKPAHINAKVAVSGFGLEGRAEFQTTIQDFVYPVAEDLYSTHITQGFGVNRHLGEDIDLPERQPICCIGDGVIVNYSAKSGYGELVPVVEHKLSSPRLMHFSAGDEKTVKVERFCSIYGHLRNRRGRDSKEPLSWRIGDKILKGQIIGFVNDDAHNGIGGEHLHMGIRLGGDPGYWVYYGYDNSPEIPSSSIKNFVAFSELIKQLQNP